MIGHPHRHFGDARRKLLIFDTVELPHIDSRQQPQIGKALPCADVHSACCLGIQRLKTFHLQPPQLAIGDDEEIAAAARRIEQVEPRQSVLKLLQRRRAPGAPRL